MAFRWKAGGGSRNLISAVYSLCACVALVAARAQSPSAAAMDQQFQAAMAAQDRGDLETAKQVLLELRRQRPGIFAVDESLGLLYVAQGNFAEALPVLQAAAREQASSDAAHANVGAALYKLHRNNEALAEFQQAVRLNPKNVVAQQSLGELWLNARRPERAVEAFAAAVRLKPGDDDLAFSYAAALIAAKRYDDAWRTLAASGTAENSSLAQSLIGEIDERKGNFESAAQHFTKAVELEPSEENVWALGVEFLRHWTFEAAIKEFQAGRENFPSSMRMRFGLGAAYFGDGSYAKAIPEFAALLSSQPNNATYAQMLGISCTAATQEPSHECELLVTYANAHPVDAEAATYAANWLLTDADAQANTARAEMFLKSAVRRQPDLAEAQYGMGLLKQNQSDWKGSVSYLERAVALKPELAQSHYRLALAYWRTGRKADGQREMELQKKYASEEKADLDRRLRQITTFVVEVDNAPSR